MKIDLIHEMFINTLFPKTAYLKALPEVFKQEVICFYRHCEEMSGPDSGLTSFCETPSILEPWALSGVIAALRIVGSEKD